MSALVLRRLKAEADAWLGEPFDSAVIIVPAYFSDPQRKTTRLAGELAGLRAERLVFDLEGCAFDVSLVEI